MVMSNERMRQPSHTNNGESSHAFTAARLGLLQRCACGGTPGPDGECAQCRQKRLQRQSTTNHAPTAIPASVQHTLHASSQPLDGATRTFMEERFGHTFGQVRIHTDGQAAQSARDVHALAYTVGRDVVFGAGQYQPQTGAGRRLIAHELTHVVQQGAWRNYTPQRYSLSDPKDAAEREATAQASRVASGLPAEMVTATESDSRLLRQLDLDAGVSDFPDAGIRDAGEPLPGGVSTPPPAGPPLPPPAPAQAVFAAGRLTVSRGSWTEACAAFTSSTAPTPTGTYCIRRQGAAQTTGGLKGFLGAVSGAVFGTLRQDHSRWYLIEPQFATTRSRMQIHYGARSEGCITVTDAGCFQRIERILNTSGTTTRTGYDGYPPGNSDGVTNPSRSVDCVGILEVR